jgi:SAM-dependent methyltransferase
MFTPLSSFPTPPLEILSNLIPYNLIYMPLLFPQRDPMGAAIRDYHAKGSAKPLRVLSTMFDDDVLPVSTLFRSVDEMNKMEQVALSCAEGRVLDVGAGAGCHTLPLQERGLHVTAIDVSPLSVETMQQRGVIDARQEDFFTMASDVTFDTILMLMNGTGIVGTLDNLPLLFDRLDTLLAPGGQLLVDSSDLRYVFEDEDGNFDPTEFDNYYGEVDYQMVYGKVRGERFNWLYVDFPRLQSCAEMKGYRAELLCKGENYDYLACIKRK